MTNKTETKGFFQKIKQAVDANKQKELAWTNKELHKKIDTLRRVIGGLLLVIGLMLIFR